MLWITGAQSTKFTEQAFIASSFFADTVFGNPKMNTDTINFGSDVKLAAASFTCAVPAGLAKCSR